MEIVTKSPRQEHLGVLDGMRGLAIGLVFAFHALSAGFGIDAPAWAGWHRAWPLPLTFWALLPAYLGWGEVAMFFVVSGFCIHLGHVRSAELGFTRFFVRRFFRIYPPYLVALLFFALVFPMTRLEFTSRHEVDQLLTHVLLLHNGLGPGFVYGVNPAFWSIGVEVQLYLLYPALLWVAGRAGWRRALLWAATAEVGMRTAFGFFDPGAPGRLWLLGDPLMYGLSWALGAHLAECWMRGEALPLAKFPASLWAGLAVGSYFFAPLYGFGFLLWALATATMLARLLSPARSNIGVAFWQHAWLRRIGLVSYSIYLLHQPLEEWVGRALRAGLGGTDFAGWISFAACLGTFPVVTLISWGFYRGVELPSIAFGKRLLRFRGKDSPAARRAAVSL